MELFAFVWRRKDRLLIYTALIVITLLNLLPIALTLIVSFKRSEDVSRVPPQLFPCDTDTTAFDPAACRWSV